MAAHLARALGRHGARVEAGVVGPDADRVAGQAGQAHDLARPVGAAQLEEGVPVEDRLHDAAHGVALAAVARTAVAALGHVDDQAVAVVVENEQVRHRVADDTVARHQRLRSAGEDAQIDPKAAPLGVFEVESLLGD